MLKVNCDVCHKEITEPGGLLFSPPDKITGSVWKYHICNSCYSPIAHDLFMSKLVQESDEACEAKVLAVALGINKRKSPGVSTREKDINESQGSRMGYGGK